MLGMGVDEGQHGNGGRQRPKEATASLFFWLIFWPLKKRPKKTHKIPSKLLAVAPKTAKTTAKISKTQKIFWPLPREKKGPNGQKFSGSKNLLALATARKPFERPKVSRPKPANGQKISRPV
tara:strand:- start:75 stop:440 length:366 start_codon:yes stop_codon:yes gene_type:complete